MTNSTNETTESKLVAVLAAPWIILLMTPFGILRAWIIQTIYTWFLVPIGAPHLNLWRVYGLTLLIGLLAPPPSKAPDGLSDALSSAVARVVAAFIVLGVCFIIKTWAN